MRIDYDAPAMLKLMESTDPLYSSEPGTRWAYSNTAFVLLGLVIETVTGKPYAETFKRRLFEPAGLNDTAVDNAADVVPHRASGYSPHPGGEGQFDNCSFISMTVPGAAGNLRSTADDLCRWHRALFAGKIVKPESLAEMVKPARLKNGALPSMPASGPATAPRVIEYGFGLQVEHVADHAAIGHGGGINGFGSHVESFVPEEVSVALLVNMDGSRELGPRSTALRTALAKAGLGLA
jgi:CubicO group peptidase (beta-lactamase class C family)